MKNQNLEPETEQMLAEVREPGPDFDTVALRIAACANPGDDLLNPFLDTLQLWSIYRQLYRRFCRSLWARFKRYSGERLAFELVDAVDMWEKNGLDRVLLQRVAVEAWRLLRLKSEEAREAALRPS
jgi:hypothetical protein